MFRPVVFAVCLLLAVTGAEATPQARTAFAIFSDVSRVILGYPSFTVFDDVGADVSGETVVLVGKVTMAYKRDAIVQRVSKVNGVQKVVNRITVLPVSRFDDDLRSRIARAIYGHSAFWHYAAMPHPPIHIVVEGGHVRLTGVVHNEVERLLARSLASSLGAFSVRNDLKTDAEMPEILEHLKSE